MAGWTFHRLRLVMHAHEVLVAADKVGEVRFTERTVGKKRCLGNQDLIVAALDILWKIAFKGVGVEANAVGASVVDQDSFSTNEVLLAVVWMRAEDDSVSRTGREEIFR